VEPRFASAGIALLLAAGCASGGDGVNPRDRDASAPPPRIDATIPVDDAGEPPTACDPPCVGDTVCRAGACEPAGMDGDGDGVDVTLDCDDSDPTIGRTADRDCSSMCGTGVERCTDGEWETCTAPTTCDCEAGAPPRMLDCGMCGTQRQVCSDGAWVDDGACMGEGPCGPGDVDMGSTCGRCGREERRCNADCTWGAWTCVDEGACMAGETDTETRSCSTSCGGTETRSRTCSGSCTWGGFGAWSGCPSCGPVCGDGTCESGETCSSCADCRADHLGSGDHGDSCAGVPENQWRCVTRSDGFRVSQVCRSGAWVNFNLTPRDCNACVCSFSLSCCQAGSTTPGC